MKQLRVGLAGFGFIGPHHLDAIRRTGLAEVTAIATTDARAARAKARRFGIEKAYGDWRELVADPDLDVIDVATPTHLHAPIALAALAAGRHVIVDKPMALTLTEAKAMERAARSSRRVHAVTFNIRYNAMVQQARALVAAGKLGEVRLVRGHYLQEWLLRDTDFNWRIESGLGGALGMVADAGAHWYDLAEHVTGQRIVRVLADLATFISSRRRPAAGAARTFGGKPRGRTQRWTAQVPDAGLLLCEFENGARGQFATSALCAGHKNDLTLEISGTRSSLRWEQERPDELWVGHRGKPNQLLTTDPALLAAPVRRYVSLPGGHTEGWPNAFANLMRDVFATIASGSGGRPPRLPLPTFAAGLRVARIVDAIAASARAGGRWQDVPS